MAYQQRAALGLIDQHDSYRLPKDEEWSSWVRLTDEQGASPYEKTLPHENSRGSLPVGVFMAAA